MEEEVHTASKITDSDRLKPIASLHSLRSDRKVMATVQDTSHPANHLFQPLSSGRRYRALRAGTSRCLFLFFLFWIFFFLDSETKLAAKVPKQDPNTQKVKKKTDFNRTQTHKRLKRKPILIGQHKISILSTSCVFGCSGFDNSFYPQAVCVFQLVST